MYVFCVISYLHFCSYMIYCTYVAICWKKWTHTVPEAERSRFCTGMLLSLAFLQSWWCSLLVHHSPSLKTGRVLLLEKAVFLLLGYQDKCKRYVLRGWWEFLPARKQVSFASVSRWVSSYLLGDSVRSTGLRAQSLPPPLQMPITSPGCCFTYGSAGPVINWDPCNPSLRL